MRYFFAVLACTALIAAYAMIGALLDWNHAGGVLPLLILFGAMAATWRKIINLKAKKNKGPSVIGSQPETKKQPSLDAKTKLSIASALSWAAFASIRTADSYEFIGIEFDRWRSGSFGANLIIPPLLVFAATRIYKWINAGVEEPSNTKLELPRS